jgi:hypothetical protein
VGDGVGFGGGAGVGVGAGAGVGLGVGVGVGDGVGVGVGATGRGDEDRSACALSSAHLRRVMKVDMHPVGTGTGFGSKQLAPESNKLEAVKPGGSNAGLTTFRTFRKALVQPATAVTALNPRVAGRKATDAAQVARLVRAPPVLARTAICCGVALAAAARV